MHLRVERTGAAAERFERERRIHVGDRGQLFRIKDAEGKERGRKVRAVHEREPFLERRQQLLGGEAEDVREVVRVADRGVGRRVETAGAEEDAEEVRERTEIAARSYRAVNRDDRDD